MTKTHYKARRFASFAELKLAAEGNWASIFQDLAPELSAAAEHAPRHVSCPVHGGNDGFRFFADFNRTGGGVCNSCGTHASGFAMIAWVRGISMKDATREVARWFEDEAATPTPRKAPAPPPVVEKPVDYAKNYQRIREIWTTSVPLAGSPAERYLANRGIWRQNMPPTLRFHPGMRYYHDKKSYGVLPFLVAPIKNAVGRIVTLHRIFISEDGHKAPVPQPKKMMARAADVPGSAIKLFQADKVLGIAEGIETALAAHAISRMPVWSTVAAPFMETVEVPESVEHVVIWADLDAPKLHPTSGKLMPPRGAVAAERLAERMKAQGKTVEILMPPGIAPVGADGIDWLDVLLTQGLEGFPEHWRIWKDTRVAA